MEAETCFFATKPRLAADDDASEFFGVQRPDRAAAKDTPCSSRDIRFSAMARLVALSGVAAAL